MNNPSIAVIVPCYNEEITISKVISDFQNALPKAQIYVYDNNSKDNTYLVAKQAGATVYLEKKQGKGNVIRRAFADVEADIYIMVDGDDTYDANIAPSMIDLLNKGSYDYINGLRKHSTSSAYRPLHTLGNKILSGVVALLFGREVKDMLSGYKVLSRRFVKSFPIISSGFEIETELMVHALELDVPISEVEIAYKERPKGSSSKLSTYKDGYKILKTIISLVESEKPLFFFNVVSIIFLLTCLILGIPIFLEFLNTGLVLRFPTAMLAGFMGIISIIAFFAGLILHHVQRTRHEMKKLAYLTISSKKTL